MVSVELLGLGVIVGTLLVLFFLYLMLRKSFLSFREGFQRGRR